MIEIANANHKKEIGMHSKTKFLLTFRVSSVFCSIINVIKYAIVGVSKKVLINFFAKFFQGLILFRIIL